MKSRRIIIIFSIIVFFSVAVVLTGVLFRIDPPQVIFAAKTRLNPDINEAGLEKSIKEFEGKNILFLDEKSLADMVEADCPYIKVVNIERIFPKTIRITVQERIEVYCFQIGENYVYTDYTCKILRIEKNETPIEAPREIYGSVYGQAIEVKVNEEMISNYDYDDAEKNKGKILEFKVYGATKFLTELYLNTTNDPIFFRKYIKSVDIKQFYDTLIISPTAVINVRTGAKFILYEPSQYGEEFILIMNGLMGVNSEPIVAKQIDNIIGDYVIRYKDGKSIVEGKPFY